MNRRSLLGVLASGSTLITAGCLTGTSTSDTSGKAYNPRGQAVVRPLDEPYIQHGLTEDSEQYLYGRLFQSTESLAVTGREEAADFSDAVDDLAEDQFAILTTLRTAAAAPAYFWPTETDWNDELLRIDFQRQTLDPVDTGNEAVGVALTTFDYEGSLPDTVELTLPSGALLTVSK